MIISGGADQGNNHIRYWNDCAMIYRALVEYYGYADDHIRVCISDGTSPAVDRSDGTNSPADLDGDGDADIEYPATQTYISQVFGELAATLTPSDQLFIFTTDHGGQASGHDCYLNLWGGRRCADDQIAAHVATLPCQSIICTFEQCYSGGMIDDLAGDGRVIATAANWDQLSWAMGPDYVYDTFVYHWTSAVAWETPAGVPVDADTQQRRRRLDARGLPLRRGPRQRGRDPAVQQHARHPGRCAQPHRQPRGRLPAARSPRHRRRLRWGLLR